jgi:hypothetical protein
VGIRHDDGGDPEGGDLGERRRSRSADHEVGRHERSQHIVAEERVGPVAVAAVGWQLLALRECRGIAGLAADVQHVDAFHEPRQGRGHRRIEAADGLGAAEDEDRRGVGGQAEPGSRVGPLDEGHVSNRGAREKRGPVSTGEGDPGRLVRDRQRLGQPRGRPDRTPRDRVALPENDRDPQRARGENRRDRDVAAGREDRGGSLRGEDRGRLRHRQREPKGVDDGVDREIDGSQRAQRQAPDADPGVANEVGLEPPMAAEPDEVRRGWSIAK